jgi:ATP-binding protein involved in chromosome partitioning
MSRQAEIPGVAAVIAVASGKGGVGKSTTAVNLALGLRALGLRVGLLDADIYGPSVPRLTGIHEKPQLTEDRKMIPIERFGLSIMSIGFLVEEDTAMIWRGPMVMSAIPRCCATSPGARLTCSWSTCRPARAMRSSRWRRTCR